MAISKRALQKEPVVEPQITAWNEADAKQLLLEAQTLITELERRYKVDKLKYYKPHPKQEMFHRCKKRNRWALGGNRTGKTECGAVELVWMARGIHPFRHITRPMDLWAVSLTNEVQRDVAQQKVLSYLNPAWIKGVKMREGRTDDPAHGVIDFILVESVHGGNSVIGFKSCDQGRERFQGTSKDGIWFDEEPPKEIYTECLMRTLDCQGEIWGTMTPLKGLTWVYEDIYLNYGNDPEAWYIAISWEDNPYLSESERQRMLSNLTEEEIEARRHGKFVALSALVYKEFKEDVHVIEPFPVPREWQDMITIDPGMDHPLAALWCAVDHDGNVYVVAEHYRRGWNIAQHMREIERISTELDWNRDIRGHVSCLMDAAADQRTIQGERTVAELFRDAGLNVNTNVNKSKWAGIQMVKNYLTLRPHPDEKRWPDGKPKLFIFSTCVNLIREMKGYRWKENNSDTGREETQKINDDCVDALRYYIMSRPEGSAPKCMFENPLLAHKKRLAKRLRKNRR
jgi:phage terminase large subunit-like protein